MLSATQPNEWYVAFEIGHSSGGDEDGQTLDPGLGPIPDVGKNKYARLDVDSAKSSRAVVFAMRGVSVQPLPRGGGEKYVKMEHMKIFKTN